MGLERLILGPLTSHLSTLSWGLTGAIGYGILGLFTFASNKMLNGGPGNDCSSGMTKKMISALGGAAMRVTKTTKSAVVAAVTCFSVLQGFKVTISTIRQLAGNLINHGSIFAPLVEDPYLQETIALGSDLLGKNSLAGSSALSVMGTLSTLYIALFGASFAVALLTELGGIGLGKLLSPVFAAAGRLLSNDPITLQKKVSRNRKKAAAKISTGGSSANKSPILEFLKSPFLIALSISTLAALCFGFFVIYVCLCAKFFPSYNEYNAQTLTVINVALARFNKYATAVVCVPNIPGAIAEAARITGDAFIFVFVTFFTDSSWLISMILSGILAMWLTAGAGFIGEKLRDSPRMHRFVKFIGASMTVPDHLLWSLAIIALTLLLIHFLLIYFGMFQAVVLPPIAYCFSWIRDMIDAIHPPVKETLGEQVDAAATQLLGTVVQREIIENAGRGVTSSIPQY